MKIECIKFSCSECCKRYWITLLPVEAKKIAKKLNLGEREFLENKCVLIAHLYSRQQAGNGLTINSQLLPNKAAEFVEQKMGTVPPCFLVLPSLALKRDSKGECVFLRKGGCETHSIVPAICKLFPFVALSKQPLKEVYPFCVALQQKGFENTEGKIDAKQKKKINSYFNSVERKGFSSQWLYLPKKGIVLLEGEKELAISKKEFLQLIQPFI